MQGYELRNKEAKYAYFHHSNGKSDVHIQVLKSLYDKFNCWTQIVTFKLIIYIYN